MPYIEASKFSEVIKTMDFVELRLYMKNLLLALAHIHSLGIIHRYRHQTRIFRDSNNCDDFLFGFEKKCNFPSLELVM